MVADTLRPAERNAIHENFSEALNRMSEGMQALGQAITGAPVGAVTRRIPGDPGFPEWDGRPSTLVSWTIQATQLKEIRGLSDPVAIQYARLKLEGKIQGIYPTRNPPTTWAAFLQFLLESFLPTSYRYLLRLNMANLQMRGNDYLSYLTDFQQLMGEDVVDETTACALFAKGLSPYLQCSVLSDREPTTLEEMKKRARKAHYSVAAPLMTHTSHVTTQLGPVPMDLDLMKTSSAEVIPTPPIFAGPSILRDNPFPAESELDQ